MFISIYILVDDIHCVLEDGNIIDAFFSVNSASDCQVIVYYSIGFSESTLNSGCELAKVGMGLC